MAPRRAVLAVALLAGAALVGCFKRNKPAPMERVALGGRHGCGVLANGALACWGDNASGQVGDGTREPRLRPVAVELDGRVKALALGARHSCALVGGGTARCWGAGERGQLGTGRTEDALAPARVLGDGYEAIVAGGDHTCAFGREVGLRCWGENADGELDDGTTDARSAPVEPRLAKGARVTAVALGVDHACFAIERGEPAAREVRCAGRDVEGQTAHGAPVLVGTEIAGLAVGGAHSCALTKDGRVLCWGAGAGGQLGNGERKDVATPVVAGVPAAVEEIRAGLRHTCARLRTKVVMCWGDNDHHQLANGTNTPSAAPVPIFGLVRVTGITTADESTCAHLEDGAVRCWGANARGELGDGTTVEHDVPMPVKADPSLGGTR